jgi:integrase/recombinase XerD
MNTQQRQGKMKKQNSTMIGPLLENFFVEFLCTQKHVSAATIASYRDTMRLLLQYLQAAKGIAPAAARITDLDAAVILGFLNHLEENRKNSARSRNARLAAIRSFFRVVALRDPSSVNQASRILNIPTKRCDRKIVRALSREEVDAILNAPDLQEFSGRRDHALLLTLYNTGARVSEIVSLQQSQFHFAANSYLEINGKGRKQRSVPLWSNTAKTLQYWFEEVRSKERSLAFPSAVGKTMTRNGLDYILQQAVLKAAATYTSLRGKKITPHMIRHSTATHLLQSGVSISVIALWLGHESIETTHVYVEADLATKERALSKVSPAGAETTRFKAQDEVLAFLATL